MAISTSEIVRVNQTLTAPGSVDELGKTLFLSSDASVRRGLGAQRARSYSSATAVSADFGSTSVASRAAQTYFSQVPYPKDLIIGRFNAEDTAATLRGGAIDYTTAAGLSAGTLVYPDADGSVTLTLADLASADTAAKVATIVNTAVAGASDAPLGTGSTCVADGGVLLISFVGTSNNGVYFTGTAAAALGLDAGSGGVITSGYVEEDIGDALTSINAEATTRFYFIGLDPSLNDSDNMESAALWAEAAQDGAVFCAESNDLDTATAGASGTPALDMVERDLRSSFLFYSGRTDYKALSMAARMSSVNFGGSGTLITAMFRQLPGTVPDDLDSTTRGTLDDRNINYYSALTGPGGGRNVVINGKMIDGVFLDVKYWVDWFSRKVREDVMDLLVTNPRIPQTNTGISALHGVISRVCESGKINGGIAPGNLDAATTATMQQVIGRAHDGYLPNGYLIHIGDLASQSATDRANRKTPPIRVFLKASGAFQNVSIDVSFNS